MNCTIAVDLVLNELHCCSVFQMKFSTADMQAHFKEIIDEIKIFEGINHPNLVRYYGVEVHRVSYYCNQRQDDSLIYSFKTGDFFLASLEKDCYE